MSKQIKKINAPDPIHPIHPSSPELPLSLTVPARKWWNPTRSKHTEGNKENEGKKEKGETEEGKKEGIQECSLGTQKEEGKEKRKGEKGKEKEGREGERRGYWSRVSFWIIRTRTDTSPRCKSSPTSSSIMKQWGKKKREMRGSSCGPTVERGACTIHDVIF